METNIRQSRRPRIPRTYLVLVLGVFTLSILFSPPSLKPGQVQGVAGLEGIAPVKSADELTIKLSQKLGQGDIGVVAKDLRSGDTYALAADREFDAASVMKLVIVGYMYHEASNDQFDLDERLTIPAGDVQRYGTGNIQYESSPYRYTYRELAKRMMENSDNTAAYVLAKQLDKDKLQAFADEQGLGDTSIADNTTTAGDMAKFLEKLYQGELADSGLTKDMLGILNDSDFEDRLPARLPKEANVYHKTGDAFGGGLHDAGVVTYQDHTYVVAIFTEGLGDKSRAAPKIADASRDIFAYEIGRR